MVNFYGPILYFYFLSSLSFVIHTLVWIILTCESLNNTSEKDWQTLTFV